MAFDEKNHHTIVLGALLHDIGKLVQRAQDDPTSKKHTEWGHEWLRKHSMDDAASLSTIAHHYSKEDDYVFSSNFGLIWYQADNLASKERKGREDLEEGKWHAEIAIASPFSRINNPGDVSETPPLTFLPLISGGIAEARQTEPPCSKKDYKRLLDLFEEDLLALSVSERASVNFLLMLFEKHLRQVPSITMRIYDGMKREELKGKHPDLSLYDHSKLTAAIAGCMYHYYSTTYPAEWDNKKLLTEAILNVSQEERPYLMTGGDISGIQRFIYTITSKGALKSLKGRSFFLELLTEHIVSELLMELGLTRCNLIFAGGGHFYILSHNTEGARSAITRIKERINGYLFREFGVGLQLHLEWETFHPGQFQDSTNLWGNLGARLENSKKKKWRDRLGDAISIQMPHADCLTEYCEICFREDTRLASLAKGGDTIYEAVCDSCSDQFVLGETLKKLSAARNPVIYRFESEPPSFTIKIDRAYYRLATQADETSDREAEVVYRINDVKAENYAHPGSIYFPVGIYQHKGLEELTQASEMFGIDRIAVLRMDVDNLGAIFSRAVPKEHRTFSRMAAISRGLNEFFKNHLNGIVAGTEQRAFGEPTDIVGRNVQATGRMLTVVYSGGDDLFLVGHWLDVTEAAVDVQRHFSGYTGNPFVTISGGIAINHNKYPIYQYARDAEDAERIAKSELDVTGKASKNAITLFGHTFGWSDVPELLERVQLFARFLKHKGDRLAIDEKKLPKTFFYRLLALARRYNKERVLILPKAAYLMSRVQFGKDNHQDTLKVKEVIMTNSEREWKMTETASMWILMLTRKGGRGK